MLHRDGVLDPVGEAAGHGTSPPRVGETSSKSKQAIPRAPAPAAPRPPSWRCEPPGCRARARRRRFRREASESYPQAMGRPENILKRPVQAVEGRRVKYVSQPTTGPCSYVQRVLKRRLHPAPTNLASPTTSDQIHFYKAIASSSRSGIILKLIAESRWPKAKLIANHIGTATCLKYARTSSRPYRSLFGKYWAKTQSKCANPFILSPYPLRVS